MPKPPPRSSSGSSTPCSRCDLRVQAEQPAGRDLEAAHVEDLRADVGVQPAQLELGAGQDRRDRRRGLPAGQRQAELLVLVRRRDVLVGVRLDADGDPHHDGRATPCSRGERRRRGRSRRGSRRRCGRRRPRARAVDLGVATCCCRAGRSARRDTGAQRDGELAAGAGVEAQPLLGDPAGDRVAEERLARVVDVGAAAEVGEGVVEGVAEGAGPGAEVGLVERRRRACRAPRRGRATSTPPTASDARRRARTTCSPTAAASSSLTSAGGASHGRGAVRRVQRPRLVCAVHIRSGARDAEQAEAVGEHLPGRVVEPQPGAVDVGDLLVAAAG